MNDPSTHAAAVLGALIAHDPGDNPDCINGDHSWQPSRDRETETIRCARCLWSPHVKTERSSR